MDALFSPTADVDDPVRIAFFELIQLVRQACAIQQEDDRGFELLDAICV